MAIDSRISFVCQFAVAAMLVLSFGAPASAQQQNEATNAPRIQNLAIVNGSTITRQELANECVRRFGSEILERLVNKMLVFEECQRRGIAITEKDVNDELTSQAAKLGWTADRYIKLLCDKKRISVDRLKRDTLWSELALRRLAESQTQVSDEEIEERLKFRFGPKVQVRQLAVNSAETAQALLAQVKADPASFEKVCKDHSIDKNSGSMGGLLPPIRINSGLPELEQVAFSLEPGQISEVFQIEQQFFIVKCVRKIEETKLDESSLQATSQQISEEIAREKLRDAAINLFQQMQARSEIVNVMNDEQLRRQNPGVAAIVNGKPIKQKMVAEECIVEFGTTMLAVLIRNRLIEQSLQQSGRTISEERTQQLIDEEIARVAESRGFIANGKIDIDSYLKFISQGDASKVEFYIEDEVWPTIALKELVKDQVQVTEEDMQKSFEANYGPRVEVLAMMFRDQRSATEIWKMATDNPSEEFFGKLANQYSIEPMSKNNYGEIPPIQKYSGRPTLEKEAFSLQPGEISKVIHLGDYWTFLFCRGRTKPQVSNIDDVREYIYKDVLNRKTFAEMEIARQKMFQEAQIDNYLTGTSQPGQEFVRQARAEQAQQGQGRTQ